MTASHILMGQCSGEVKIATRDLREMAMWRSRTARGDLAVGEGWRWTGTIDAHIAAFRDEAVVEEWMKPLKKPERTKFSEGQSSLKP